MHLSDVVAVLAGVSGVRATRRVRIGGTAGEASGGPIAWSLPIDEGRVGAFDIQSSRIRLMSAGAVALDSTDRPDLAAAFAGQMRESPAGNLEPMSDAPGPAGRDRKLASYRPLRLDLPLAYGVRPGALGAGTPPARRAAANQLRAYLAIIDALLANLFAQLDGAKDLLSPAPGRRQSYFTQAAEDLSLEAPLLASAFDRAALQEMVEPTGGQQATVRRNRFLSHLLARFGEQVPSVPRPVAAGLGGEGMDPELALLDAREAFLGSIVRLGAGRGSGADLLLDGDEPPLLQRIRLKLGLPKAAEGRILLVEHILLRGIADDVPAALPILYSAASGDPYSLQLSFVIDERLKAGPGDSDKVAQVIRDECPAHLVAYIRWLGEQEFDAFAASYRQWLSALRNHRLELLGFGAP